MSKLNRNLTKATGLTRRIFVRECAMGAMALGLSPVLARAAAFKEKTDMVRGAARRTLALDCDWLFSRDEFDAASLAAHFDDRGYQRVSLPHCAADLSWQDWNPADWRRMWSYRRHFTLPEEFRGLRVFVHFDGVMRGFTPVINGHELPAHLGGYLPVRYEITPWLVRADNVLAVAVDGRTANVPPGAPDGSARIDYLEPAGIHRSVWLEAVPRVFISDVHAKPVDVLSAERSLDVSCTIDAAALPANKLTVRVELLDRRRVVASQDRGVNLQRTGETEINLTLTKLGGVKLWDVDTPNLYSVVTTLLVDGRPVHDHTTRVGFRDARFQLDGFFLNGRRLQLFGLNRHELYPYSGFAMPPRVMRRDAEILRHQFNCNMVRCSHYPQSPAFLDACDELGLLVWEEVPGWQYLGDGDWQDLLVRDVETMVRRDRNRPSIIIWGTRANESHNNENLYRRTRAAAKALDDSRPTSGSMTGGTRRTWETEWHEDVFAFDDYHGDHHGGVGILDPVPGVPYLLAEAVGQFNYAKGEKFDSYYRRADDIANQCRQALYHAQAHSRAGNNPRICGVLAWCAFEYGSPVHAWHGVKYPGVADVFRIPKLGASFYLAQTPVNARPVIEPNFYWDFNPLTPRGPGKGAAIFSNCDRLEVFVDGRHHATVHPDAANYPNLAHAPFFVDLELDGAGHPELRIDGFVGDRLALSRKFASHPAKDRLTLAADDAELAGNGIDATRIEFRVVDCYGAPRPLTGGEVTFQLEGPGILLGDNPFSLAEAGGAGAVWLRALRTKHPGRVTIRARHQRYGSGTTVVEVRPAEDLSTRTSNPYD